MPVACICSLAASSPAVAQAVSIDIPAGPLTPALAQLARQAGVSIGTPTVLPLRSVNRLRGTMPVAVALRRLLEGSGWRAVEVAPHVWRVERAPPRRVPPAPAPARLPVVHHLPVATTVPTDIVVMATKRATRIDAVALPVAVLDGSAIDDADARDAATLGRSINGLFTTNLGIGRDRLFIRGVADGPFDGFAQSSVAVYLGGTRATYDAPDPGLRLFDCARSRC